MGESTSAAKHYTTVLRFSESLIRLPANRGIRIHPMQSPHGEYELLVFQRTEKAPHIDEPLPRELCVQVSGPAPSIEIALDISVGSAVDYVRQIAFGANSWHGLPNVHLAYESTPGSTERQFFQNWILDERGIPRVAREIDPDLIFRLLVAVAQTPAKTRARVLRAITQYTDALQHSKAGGELYALAHLYMGVEAITPCVIHKEVQRRGLKTRKQLEIELNGPPASSLIHRISTYFFLKTGGYIPNRLDPWARETLVFRGDREVFKAAKTASNKYEHGTAQHAELHTIALQATAKTFAYLREAILELLPLTDDDRSALTTNQYAKPLSTVGFDRQFLATIIAANDVIAAPEESYPRALWEFNLQDYRRLNSGQQEMQLSQKITPVIANGAQFRIERVRFAGPTPTSHTNVEFDVSTGDKPKEEIVTKAGAQLAIDPPGIKKWADFVGMYVLNASALQHLGRFWVSKLDQISLEETLKLDFAELMDRIRLALSGDPRLSSLSEQALGLWAAAAGADEAKRLFAEAFIGEHGLVVPSITPEGRAAELTEPDKIKELIDHTVDLNKKLAALLDEILEVRDGPTPPN